MLLQGAKYSLTPLQKFYSLLSLLFCGGAVLFLFDTPFSPSGAHTLCLFRNISGLPCPGCGMGRGVEHLLHLQFAEAVSFNPLSVFVLPAIVITVCWMTHDIYADSESLFKFYLKCNKYFSANRITTASIALVILSVWIWNIIKQ